MINRLWCLIVGHKMIRVFDRVDITAVSIPYGIEGRVLEQHKECIRCKKKLK